MSFRHCLLHFLFVSSAAIGVTKSVTAVAQDARPILVVFHGIGESGADLSDVGASAFQTGSFSEVILTEYDWRTETVPAASARIFNVLIAARVQSKFVLYGFNKGGLIAEWIATRVKEAEGRIVRVITIDAPFEGVQGPVNGMNNAVIEDMAPNASTLQVLKTAPLNNIRAIEFVRVWEKNSALVRQDAALRKPIGGENNTSQLIVRTKPFDPHEVIPEILEQARKDFKAEQFPNVIEACRYILKAEPKHGEANALLGLSLYNSAMHEADQARATESFAESVRYLAVGASDGMEYKMPVAHHHNMGVTQFGALAIGDVCYGQMIISQGMFGFMSNDDARHRFLVPISWIRDLSFESNGSGRLHLEIGFRFSRAKEEKLKAYNFLPVRVTKSTTILPLQSTTPIGVNNIACNQGEGCNLGLQALYRLIGEVRKLPEVSLSIAQDSGITENIETTHFAVRAKNKHAGVMSFSTTGLQWRETGSNSDPKHDFSVSWEKVKDVSYMPFGLILLIEDNKKKRMHWIECDTDRMVGIVKQVLKHAKFSPRPL